MRKRRLWPLLFSSFFLLGSIPILAETIHLKVRATVANIRIKPDMAGTIVGQVRAGTILESEQRLGDWFKVTLPVSKEGTKTTGYIHISTVDIQSGAPQIGPPKPPRGSAYVSAPIARPASISRLGLRITGGLAYLAAGDANANLIGATANWNDRALQPGSGMTVTGGAQAIHWGPHFEANVVYSLNPRLGVGLGVGFLRTGESADKSRMVITSPDGTRTTSRETALSAIPVQAGVFYDLVQAGRFNLAVNAGLGLYFARWKELEDCIQTGANPFDGRYETSMHAVRLGFHGGLSLEYRINRGISLVVEGFGRYARFSGFSGEYRQTNSGGLDATDQGKLYYYEWEENGKTYFCVQFFEKDPNELNLSTPIKNSRLAVIDFSGFSLRAGIKISL
jgi:hypothetical protein